MLRLRAIVHGSSMPIPRASLSMTSPMVQCIAQPGAAVPHEFGRFLQINAVMRFCENAVTLYLCR